jgi:hypothetical protein
MAFPPRPAPAGHTPALRAVLGGGQEEVSLAATRPSSCTGLGHFHRSAGIQQGLAGTDAPPMRTSTARGRTPSSPAPPTNASHSTSVNASTRGPPSRELGELGQLGQRAAPAGRPAPPGARGWGAPRALEPPRVPGRSSGCCSRNAARGSTAAHTRPGVGTLPGRPQRAATGGFSRHHDPVPEPPSGDGVTAPTHRPCVTANRHQSAIHRRPPMHHRQRKLSAA